MTTPRLGKALGDGILAMWESRGLPSALSLAYCGWGQQRTEEPVYPVNPRTDCPRLDLYIDEEMPIPWTSGQFSTVATYTAYFKRRHLIGVGENHQTALVLDVEAILELFLPMGWRPVEVATAVPNARNYGVYLNRPVVYHPDLKHEFDDPALRVSVAEIPLKIEIRRS